MHIWHTDFVCDSVSHSIYCCKILQNVISLFTSVFRTWIASRDTQMAPSSMSVMVHLSEEVSDTSILSTMSVIGALNSAREKIQNSLDKMEKCIEKCLQEVNHSIKGISTHKSHESLVLACKYNTSLGGDSAADEIMKSIHLLLQKTEFYIYF